MGNVTEKYWEKGEGVLLCRMHDWALANRSSHSSWLEKVTFLDSLEKIDAWAACTAGQVNGVAEEGLMAHTREVLHSTLIHLEQARQSNIHLTDAQCTNEGWVDANCAFNTASVQICAALDLLGHLYWLTNEKEFNDWRDDKWDFQRRSGRTSLGNKWQSARKLPGYENHDVNFVSSGAQWKLKDAHERFRHKSIHRNYNYVVIRNEQFVVHDPGLSLREIKKDRLAAKKHQDITRSKHAGWNEIGVDRFIRIGSASTDPAAAHEVIAELLRTCICAAESVITGIGSK